MFGIRAFFKSTGFAGVLALALIFLIQLNYTQSLSALGNLVFDAYARAQPRAYEPAPVRVVDIDEESLRREGQWPWSRPVVGRLLQRLTDAGAATIALDIVFSEADRTSPALIANDLAKQGADPAAVEMLRGLPDNDQRFAEALSQMPVVNGFFLTYDPLHTTAVPIAGIAISGSAHTEAIPQYSNAVLPLAPLDAAAQGRGFLTLSGDDDGIVRRAPLLARQGDQILPALSIEALRVAQGAGSVLVKMSDGSGNIAAGADPGVVSLKVGEFEIPTTRAGELWMHYTDPVPERIIPAWKVLDPATSDAELASLFEGQIVLVGTGAIGLRDLVATPLRERELGVMVHAQAIEQAILGKFLTRPDWAEGLERTLVLLTGLALLLLLPRLGASGGAVLGLAMILLVSAGSWWAFSEKRFLLDPTFPVLAILAVYITVTVLDYYREEQARSYIHQAFDRYLSPELVKRIVADPHQLDLGGEERDMTVLFCDIRSFSRISEKLEPKAIIAFLIGFLTPMCDILLDRKATIDKFIGDAILAFWNAPLDDPDQHVNAARAALAMHERLKQLNAEMPGRKDQTWPGDVAIGIGLNSGPCCVGNMGSAQRLSYSIIGDAVNLASRIEGLTKYYGVGIAMGSALQRRLPGFAAVELDLVRVVGRDTPEAVYALLGDEALAQDGAFQSFAEGHAAMLAAYRARDWDSTNRLLDEWGAQAEALGLGMLYAMYRERVAQLQSAPPPDDWDGVFAANEK
ncbi:CHASE2 domain-containing protein [Porphyrobacter sp. LM 6]|uniref:CHASE2 domain-containing protein n=1 Tax=Porphyrobacter sp. LM 6 TaxID=1896196 RepID=UPI000846C6CC|nr:adenylate/guanylate cyclase domain-containing protein [Porphyrobacter sp. LM 6]AOL93800.1 adenylate cyclase [Porphyrobacter sp. LM 6]